MKTEIPDEINGYTISFNGEFVDFINPHKQECHRCSLSRIKDLLIKKQGTSSFEDDLPVEVVYNIFLKMDHDQNQPI